MPGERDFSVRTHRRCTSAVESPLPAWESVPRGAIEVSEFSPRQHSSLFESRTFVIAGCAAVTTLLHLALITAAIWPASRESAHPHPLEGTTAPRGQATDDIDLTWVAVDEHATGNTSRQVPPVLHSPRLLRIAMSAPISELATNFPDFATGDAHSGGANDSDSRAKIYGQYLGQVNARIDRAWIRPHASIGAAQFLCQVLIEQDAVGNVKEVTLDRCNGTPAWQRSLVDAIKSASPLSAPADPAVFAPKIQMVFREEAPDEALTADSRLSASSENASINSESMATSLAVFRQIRNTSAHSIGTAVIDLRIEGHATEQARIRPTAASQPSDRMTVNLSPKPGEAGETPESKQYH